jgi:uncharacterized protein YbcI
MRLAAQNQSSLRAVHDSETKIIAPDACRGIARAAVSIWKESIGRGAESAQAFAGGNGISMIFRGNLTTLEKTAVERGEAASVAQIRREVFEANRERLIEAVERESGRKVEAALYAPSPEQDMSAFTFVLAPRDEE